MSRWLIRFGYDGAAFAGWAAQPGRTTIEGEILRGWRRRSAGGPVEHPRLEVASRTDRGVSAVGNALALSSSLTGPALLGRLNGIRPDLFFTAATSVGPYFRPRATPRRTYRYFEPGSNRDLPIWKRAAGLFKGPVDVRSFGRQVPAREPTWRMIESISVEPLEEGLQLEITAPSFVWGMVRKIVSALREVERARLSMARLEDAVKGRVRLMLPLAEPEGLVLWDVAYDIPWTVRWPGPNRQQSRHQRRDREAVWVRERVLEELDRVRAQVQAS